jgi:CheY-like chemotaxis protein
MRVLVVDNEPDQLSDISDMVMRLGHKVIKHRSGIEALALPDRELNEIDVAVLDQRMPEMDGLETGRELKRRAPRIFLIMLTAYGSIRYAVQAIRDCSFEDYLSKPIVEEDLEVSLTRAQSFVSLQQEKEQLTYENELLSQRLTVSQELHKYDLSRYTQQRLAGIDQVLLDVAQAIQPYFRWSRGDYDKYPSHLRQSFVTGLLFEGEPGAGKSVLCETIAEAFSSVETVLPKSLGPDHYVGSWQQPLDDNITDFYSRATDDSVVVIRADDLLWPTTSGMEPSLAGEWGRYMYAVRDYVADAARINRGDPPQSRSLRGNNYEGKVLWLFARNPTEDVGEMFSPLLNYLEPISVKFPRGREDRKQILELHASNRSCKFEDTAIELAVEEMMSYSGRDLVGDLNSQKGFLPYAINRAIEHAQKLFDENQDETIGLVITRGIVEEWLNSSRHDYIMSQNAVPRYDNGHVNWETDMSARLARLEGEYKSIIDKLDRYEAAYAEAKKTLLTGKGRPKIYESIGRCAGESHVNVSTYLDRHKAEIKQLFIAFPPERWSLLRTLKKLQ